MAVFLPQARAEMPQNAMLDFSPINNAIDGNRRNAMMAQQQDIQRQELGMRREQMDMQKQRFQRDDEMATVKRLGMRAQAIDALPPNDPRRAQAWGAIMKEHPGAGGLDQSWHDPVQGPKMLIAEAGQWQDPLERRKLQAQIATAEAGVANIPLQQELLRSQINQANRKDEGAALNAQIMRQLFPGLGGDAPAGGAPTPQPMPQQQAPAQPGAPAGPGGATFQPMSDPGQPPVDPMLIQAQAATPQQAPTAPPSAIDSLTPAQRQAMGLAIMGKGDAGKILLDASQANKLGKEAANRVEGQMVDGAHQIARLKSIQEQFKPEYLMMDKIAGFRWDALMDSTSFTRKSLKPEQRQKLAEFAAFRQEATENLNRYIKEITGAQMSEAEATRLTRAMPNPGTGLFDGDSPTEFKAKMDNAIRMSQMAYARNAYLRRQGFQGDVNAMAARIPLEKMGGIIQQRTDDFTREAIKANPGATQQDVAPLVRQRLRSEFGIGA